MEHRNWEKAAAAYNKGWGPLTSQCIPEMLSSLQCSSSSKLLDVATGPGFVAEAAAKTNAEVIALDFSAQMLEIAKQRMDPALSSSIQFVEGDAAALPFEEGTFDCIACNFGVLHLPDADAFFQEAARVLKPGGRLAFTVWAQPPKSQAFDLILGAVSRQGNPNVTLPEGPPIFLFSNSEESKQRLSAAGLQFRDAKLVDQRWVLEAEDMYIAFRDGTGRTQALLLAQSEEELAAVKADFIKSALDFRSASSGKVDVAMPTVLTIAEKVIKVTS